MNAKAVSRAAYPALRSGEVRNAPAVSAGGRSGGGGVRGGAGWARSRAGASGPSRAEDRTDMASCYRPVTSGRGAVASPRPGPYPPPMTDPAAAGPTPFAGLEIAFLSWRDTHNPEGGGAERALEEVAEGLVQRGARVTVFSAAHAGAPPEDQINGVRYVRNGSKLTVYPRGMQALRRGDLGDPDLV